jgi:acetoacetate decarboxylase
MKEPDVLAKGFAMPLTSPAFPCGPFRFVNREYLIITYRTHPERPRAVVPEPLGSETITPHFEQALPNSPGKAESSH